jgi:hypothetical protein
MKQLAISLALAACTPAVAPRPAPEPVPVRQAPKPAAPLESEEARCAEAAEVVDFLRGVEAGRASPGDETCAVRAGLAAFGACSELHAEWGERLEAMLAAERADAAYVERHGRWAVQRPNHGDDRIWELTDAGPKLRYRVVSKTYRFLAGDERLLIESDDEEHGWRLVDLPTGKVHARAPLQLLADAPPYLFASRGNEVFRLRGADLAEAGKVDWGDASQRATGDAVLLRGGDTLGRGETVVAFDTGQVVADHTPLGSPRSDGARVLGWDPGAKAVIEIDAQSGAFTESFAAQGLVPFEGMFATRAAYAADPRFVFWFEVNAAPDESWRVTVAVGDTQTNKVRRLREPKLGTGTAFHLEAFSDGPYLCLRGHSFRTSYWTCDWQVSSAGVPRRAPKPPHVDKPTLATLGLQGEREIARATSPSGKRVAVASYREDPSGDRLDLKLTIADPAGKVERTIMVQQGSFPIDTTGIFEDGVSLAEGTYTPRPHLAFSDDGHLSYVGMWFPCNVVDLDAGTVDFEHPSCHPDPLAVDDGSGRLVRLVASPEAWAAAPFLDADCP